MHLVNKGEGAAGPLWFATVSRQKKDILDDNFNKFK